MKKSWLLLALGGWFGVALVLSVVAPPPLVSSPVRFAIILGPVVALTALYFGARAFRDALSELPLRVFVGVHVVRAVVGARFLILGQSGGLPVEFAIPAGYGDLAAGLGALGLLVVPNWRRRGMALALGAWCLFGIADFVNVQRVVMALQAQGRQAAFGAMNGPPLALVPYFGVPLLWFFHVVVLSRSARELVGAPRESGPSEFSSTSRSTSGEHEG
jgi:hypothetical protein